MRHVTELEARRMFAAASWDISFNGGSQYSAMFPTIKQFIIDAGNEWAALIPGVGDDLRVTVNLANGATGSTGRLSAKSVDETTVKSTATGDVFDQTATAKLRYGDADRGTEDIDINIDPGYLQSTLWFDPDPTSRTAAIPAGKVDAYSAILHELGHAFFFNGFLNADGSSTGTDKSVFDTFVTSANGEDYFFTGPKAEAVYGGAVPLTVGNMYHVANATGAGVNLQGDLMNGFEFAAATRYSISDLDKAMAADLIDEGTRPPEAPTNVVATSGSGEVTVTWQENSAGGGDVAGFKVLKDDGSGNYVTIGTLGAGVTTFNDTQVLNGAGYSYKVEAFDSGSSGVVLTADSTVAAVTYTTPSPRSLTVGDGQTMTYTGGSGQTVSVSVKGGGSVTLNFATASGNADPVSVVISGTTVKTQITFAASAAFLLRGISASTPVGRLLMPAANLTGSNDLSGVGILQVANLTGAKLAVHGTVVNGTFTLGQATDSTVTIDAPLKSLSVLSFQGTDSVSDVLTVASVAKLQTGAFNGTLVSTGVVKKPVFATVTNSTLSFTGSVTVAAATLVGTTVTAGLPSVTTQQMSASTVLGTSGIGTVKVTGTMTGSELRTGGAIGAVTVGTLSASTITAGVGATVVAFPTSNPFTGAGTIKSVKTAAFSNSLIVAPSVGKLTLGTVTTSNDSKPFGVYGNSLAGVSYVDAGVKKNIKKTSTAMTAMSGDFEVTVA